MIKGFFIVTSILLCVSGLCEIIHSIRTWLFSPKRPYNNYLILYLKRNQAILQLKFIREQHRWYGNDFAEKIIAITDNIEENELQNCFDIFDNYGVIFCPTYALANVLSSISKGN